MVTMHSRGNCISSFDNNNNAVMNPSHNSKIANDRDNNGNNERKELLCFICDSKVYGRYYYLATCKTQYSKSRVIKKLGELVGERYLVVISEDDVICRKCGILINTLDKFELEMRKIRDNIFQILEQKYNLEEGELLDSSSKPKLCQTPQITKCNTDKIMFYHTKQSEIDLETYSRDGEKHKREQWLQCDKCKYTTNRKSFMMYHHIRDYNKQILCENYQLHIPENIQGAICTPNNLENMKNREGNLITFNNIDQVEVSALEMTREQIVPFTTVETVPLTGLSISDSCLYISNVSPLGDNFMCPEQPYVLESIEMSDGADTSEKTARISESNIETSNIKRSKGETRMLTLMEDGNVKIIEIPY